MRFLVTGAGGMLGRDVIAALGERDVTALDRAALDVTDPAAVEHAVSGHDVVINCAAYTAVDRAEQLEPEAERINAGGAANLAAGASVAGAVLVQVSTDYVFDGVARTPYPELAPLAPASAYGRTKAHGETAALAGNPDRTYVVRTAWLYGSRGPSFPRAILRKAASPGELTVVDDQVGQPTWTRDLAQQLVALSESSAPFGIYHGTNSGSVSRYDFAREILSSTGGDPDRVRPVFTTPAPRVAVRPLYSVLGHDAWAGTGIPPMRYWRDAWREALENGMSA